MLIWPGVHQKNRQNVDRNFPKNRLSSVTRRAKASGVELALVRWKEIIIFKIMNLKTKINYSGLSNKRRFDSIHAKLTTQESEKVKKNCAVYPFKSTIAYFVHRIQQEIKNLQRRIFDQS